MSWTELLAIVGFIIGVIALVIAIWQVGISRREIANARREARLEGDMAALGAFLTAEIAGRKRRKVIVGLISLIEERAKELGSRDVLAEVRKLMDDE